MLLWNHQVIAFLKKWDEVQIQRLCGSRNPESTICATRSDRRRDTKMSKFLLSISEDGVCGHPQKCKVIIKQDARACAPLPVHKPDLGPAEVSQAFDSLWVSLLYDQTLVASHQRNDLNRNLRHILAYMGKIIFTRIGVKYMRTREMRLTAMKGDQPALRANIYRNKPSVMLGE